jgi:hypothetical protein
MQKSIGNNIFIQLFINTIVLVGFNVWLLLVPMDALFGGRAFEWYALMGDPVGGLVKYFFPIVLPVLLLIQGLKMIDAVHQGTWASKTQGVPSAQLQTVQKIYVFNACLCILSFCLALRFFWSLL